MAMFNQEELNAINQLVRVLSALNKAQPAIQKAIQAEEELARLEQEIRLRKADVEQIHKDTEKALEDHKSRLVSIDAERDGHISSINRQIAVQRDQEGKRLSEWVKEKTKEAQDSLKALSDRVVAVEAELKRKRQEEADLDQRITALTTGKGQLELEIDELKKTKAEHQAEIDALLSRLAGKK